MVVLTEVYQYDCTHKSIAKLYEKNKTNKQNRPDDILHIPSQGRVQHPHLDLRGKKKGTQLEMLITLPPAIKQPGVCIYQESSPRLQLSKLPMD